MPRSEVHFHKLTFSHNPFQHLSYTRNIKSPTARKIPTFSSWISPLKKFWSLTVQNSPQMNPNSGDIECLPLNTCFSYTHCPWEIYLFGISPFENPLLEHKTQGSILADFSWTTTLKPENLTFEGPGKP